MVLRMSDKDAKKAGFKEIKPKKPRKKKDVEYAGDLAMDLLCAQYGLPLPDPEYHFNELSDNPARDKNGNAHPWRFDWLFCGWLAVEKIGGVWGVGKPCKVCKRRRPGHHSYGKDQIDDMHRRNHAQMLGYVVLEFPPEEFENGMAFAKIKEVLGITESELP